MRIRNYRQLEQVISKYLEKGMTPAQICLEVNKRGIICYTVGIELIIQKMKQREVARKA